MRDRGQGPALKLHTDPWTLVPGAWITLTQLEQLARKLAAIALPGDVFLLDGDLGAGKTTFARFFIQALTGEVDVPSPTFTLVQAYETPKGEVWHCDLYRLKTPEEVEELGLEDAFHQAICLVEWPDRLGYLTPKSYVTLHLKIAGEGMREIKLEGHGRIHESLKHFIKTK